MWNDVGCDAVMRAVLASSFLTHPLALSRGMVESINLQPRLDLSLSMCTRFAYLMLGCIYSI